MYFCTVIYVVFRSPLRTFATYKFFFLFRFHMTVIVILSHVLKFTDVFVKIKIV